MSQEFLQQELEEVLKDKEVLFTRLRTPGYGFRGVRYPADYVVWGSKGTYLIECKQRKSLPLRPSDIRQLPFMRKWVQNKIYPIANYSVLVGTDFGYFLFSADRVVEVADKHIGLLKEDAYIWAKSLDEVIDRMLEE